MLSEDELQNANLLVFANKQDQPGAKGAGEISEALRLGELRDRNWSIVACSAIDGSGVEEGMDWLVVSTIAEGFPARRVSLLIMSKANYKFRFVEILSFLHDIPLMTRVVSKQNRDHSKDREDNENTARTVDKYACDFG